MINTITSFNFFENSTVQKKCENLQELFENEVPEIETFNKADDFLNIFIDFSVSADRNTSLENTINKEREDYLKTNVTNQLLEIILEESFEFGIKAKSEILIEEQLKQNDLATRNWLNKIFIDFFDDEKILIGILRIIGRFEEHIIFPQGQTMALAALNHKNPEIIELGIRAFENWGSINSIKILENSNFEIDWLSDYKNQVLNDLKEELYVTGS